MTRYLPVVSLPGWGPCAGTEFPKGIPFKIRRGRLCNLYRCQIWKQFINLSWNLFPVVKQFFYANNANKTLLYQSFFLTSEISRVDGTLFAVYSQAYGVHGQIGLKRIKARVKEGENFMDVFSVRSVFLVVCRSVFRTVSNI